MPHQLLFPKLFGKLESAFQLYGESKREQLRCRPLPSATNFKDVKKRHLEWTTKVSLVYSVIETNLIGDAKKAELRKCFRCDSTDHLARSCPRVLSLFQSAANRLEYFKENKAPSALVSVTVKMCFQLEKDELDATDDLEKILVANSFMNKKRPLRTNQLYSFRIDNGNPNS